jgi:hypothetical protein
MSSLSHLEKQVRDLIRQIDAGPPLPHPPPLTSGWVMFTRRGLGGLTLTGEEARGYRNAVAALTDWAKRYRKGVLSDRVISEHLQEAILTALDLAQARTDVALSRRVDDALSVLHLRLTRVPVMWRAVAVVSGIAMTNPVTFGPVKFTQGSAALLRRLRSSGRMILGQSLGTETGRKAAIAHFCKEVDERFGGKFLAIVPVCAVDHNAAWALAADRLEDTIDGLNFLGDLAQPGLTRVVAGTAGQPLRDASHMMCSADSITFPTWPSNGIPLQLEVLSADRQRRLSTDRVSRLLKQEPSDLQARILTALKWAARADVAERRSDRLLQYLISLEALLTGGRFQGEIGYRLRVRCAHLLATPAHRRETAREFTELYSARGDLVHGRGTTITDDQLSRARAYAKLCILRMLAPKGPGGLKTVAELEKWFETRVLA